MTEPSSSRSEFHQRWNNLSYHLTQASGLIADGQHESREMQSVINDAAHFVEHHEFELAFDLLVDFAGQQSMTGDVWLSLGLAAKCMTFATKSKELLQRFDAGSVSDSDRDDLTKVTLQEISSPSLGVTEQFFSIHQLASDPIVHLSGDAERVSIWTRIRDEPFYWVQQFQRHKNSDWKPLWGYCSHHANVYLAVEHPDKHPDEITQLLGIEPDRTCEKGAPITPRDGSRVFNSHRWYLQSPAAPATDFQSQLTALLNAIKPFAAELKAMKLGGSCGIAAALYDSVEYAYGFHLNDAMIESLCAAGLSVDFDVYHSGPSLP